MKNHLIRRRHRRRRRRGFFVYSGSSDLAFFLTSFDAARCRSFFSIIVYLLKRNSELFAG